MTRQSSRNRRARGERASTSVVAVVLLVGLTVAIASVVGGAALGLATGSQRGAPPAVSLDFTVDGDRLVFTHRAGEPLDVRDLRLRIAVDGTPLAHQPSLPFFAAPGFRSGPTGPFNVATSPTWSVGETASLGVAGTNHPRIGPGMTVEVEVYAAGMLVARLSARAG